MAVPVARVHLKVAHAAFPALLPTPPKCKMPPLLAPPPPSLAAILPNKPPLAKTGRADADERWDARKTKPAGAEPTAGHGSSQRKNTTSPPPPKPGRADSVERWDAHKKAAASPVFIFSNVFPRKQQQVADQKRCLPQAEQIDDGESSSNGSNDMDDTEEEIVRKPRAMAMYTGPGFVGAAPEPSMIHTPTSFLVRVS